MVPLGHLRQGQAPVSLLYQPSLHRARQPLDMSSSIHSVPSGHFFFSSVSLLSSSLLSPILMHSLAPRPLVV